MANYYKQSFNLSRIFGLGFTSEEREICDKLKAELEGYLNTEKLDKDLIKLLVISFNETARLGMDESIPVLKTYLSAIRHRLIEGKAYEYKRLILLLDSYIRNCGYRAQLLIGRQKFLHTIVETAKGYSEVNHPVCDECARLALDCIQSWNEAFGKYKTDFPFYEDAYLLAKNKYHLSFPRPENDKTRNPIRIELFLVADKFTSKGNYVKSDESDGTASESSEDHSASGSYAVASTSVADQKVSYLVNTRSGLFWGSPNELKN